jgi:hypothetical protein
MLAHFISSQEIPYLYVATTWKKEKVVHSWVGMAYILYLLNQCSALIDFEERKLELFFSLTFNFFKNQTLNCRKALQENL